MMNTWIKFFKQKGRVFKTPFQSTESRATYFLNFQKFIQNYFLAIISGVLVGTSYIPFPPWAVLFCYAPLWISIVSTSPNIKKTFWAAWLTQFILSLIGFYWIAYTAHEFAQIPWVFSSMALLIFACLMHLYIPIAATVSIWLKKRFSLSVASTLLTVALLHSLLERVWPSIFEWNLGYTLLYSKIPAFQLADLVGFHGLSTIVLLINAWLACIWLNRRNLKSSLLQLTTLVALCIGLVVWGAKHGEIWNKTDRQIKISVIQANIGNSEKIYAEKGQGYQEYITRKFTSLSQKAFSDFPDTDIFVWPETAFPDFLDQHLLGRVHTNILANEMGPIGRPIITGAYSKDQKINLRNDQSTYNALFLVDSYGNSLDHPYHKTHLLAFGEFLPLSEQFPFLLKLFPFIANFGRGNGPEVMVWHFNGDTIYWGGQICYEGLYPAFTRGLVQKGADILVNTTNDSWFGMGSEPYQHLYLTLARAIEVRRPLVRSTNTGYSTAIQANGEIMQKSPLHIEWYGQFALNYQKNAPLTFYTNIGHKDWILLLVILALNLVTGALHARSRRS